MPVSFVANSVESAISPSHETHPNNEFHERSVHVLFAFSTSSYSPFLRIITTELESDEVGEDGLGAEPEGKYADEG